MTAPLVLRALIADDEPLARRRVRTLLDAHSDFQTIGECSGGIEALALIEREQPDVAFLDIRMTELDGMEVARRLSATGPAVVFVTAYNAYAVDAFEVSAVDYLLKPFDEERFVAALQRVRDHVAAVRIRSRGIPGQAHRVLTAADVQVDVSTHEVRRAGRLIVLRPKEFELLHALIRRAGQVVSRRELLQEVWGYKDGVVSRTIDTHLAELRRKLAHGPLEPALIETVSRVGYRLRTS